MLKKPNLQEVVAELLQSHTQKELNKLTGVPQSTISCLKNGGRPRVSFDNGCALLIALEKAKQTQNKTPDA